MEELKRKRTSKRTAVTKAMGTALSNLDEPVPNLLHLRSDLRHLEKLAGELAEMEEKILDLLEDEEDEGQKKINDEGAEKYRRDLSVVIIRLEDAIQPPPASPFVSSQGRGSGSFRPSMSGEEQAQCKLPKIELKTFGGDMKDWLSWWGQFEKIDKNTKLSNSEKYHYLVQATVKGSIARDTVEVYAQTGDNYPHAVESLKEQFGKADDLIQFYIGEMIKVVLDTASNKEATTISKLRLQLDSYVRSLETLGVERKLMNLFLFPLMKWSLPKEVMLAWQRSSHHSKEQNLDADPPVLKMDHLMNFLKDEVSNERDRKLGDGGLLSGKKEGKSESFVHKNKKPHSHDVPTASGLHISNSGCVFCDGKHRSENCLEAQKMSNSKRWAKMSQKKVCSACLAPGHHAKFCEDKPQCAKCKRSHYTNLCYDLHNTSLESGKKEDKERKKSEATASTNHVNDQNQTASNFILLEVLRVRIDSPICMEPVRVLMDTGSERSYIREELAQSLGLTKLGDKTEFCVVFESNAPREVKRTLYDVPLLSLDRQIKKSTVLESCTRINDHVSCVPKGSWLKKLRKLGIWLSDVGNSPGKIDILVGKDILNKLDMKERIEIDDNGLMATRYIFGWTLSGPVPRRQEGSCSMLVTTLMTHEAPIHQLWDLDRLGIEDPAYHTTKEEKEAQAKKFFVQNIARNEEGRYAVSLPWVGGVQDIPSNRTVAVKRLENATRKLQKDKMFEVYDQLFRGWEKEGIIEEISADVNVLYKKHYLPHRPVYKPESLTTPVRPVFDASCKVGRNPSLNDCLEKGPNLIELIPTIMMKFREGKVGAAADIRKAFQQIDVKEADRDVLRFLWWENADCSQIKEYRHRRVVFGVNCSPFLLGAVLEYHLSKVEGDRVPAAMKLLESLYVDNCLPSFHKIEEFKTFQKASTAILEEAKMELREWEYATQGSFFPEDKPTSTVLGMVWDKKRDMLGIDPVPELPGLYTKRSALSMLHKIFDPMGILAPAMLVPKLLIQKMWLKDLDWDSELPEEIKNKFEEWAQGIKSLNEIWVPRCMTGGYPDKDRYELHVFCDASQSAYAAMVVLRVKKSQDISGGQNPDDLEAGDKGAASVQLIQCRTRVAPLKRKKNGDLEKVSIPRLELLGCTMAARLAASVKKALGWEDIPTTYHTDSENARFWIQGNDEWGTFVGNRVKEICRLSRPSEWRHVPGKSNPADFPSRGCTPAELLKSKYWEGPSWLLLPKSQWPSEVVKIDEEVVAAERRKTKCVLVSGTLPPSNLFPYNNFQKNVDFVVATQNFVHKMKKKEDAAPQSRVDQMAAAEKTMFLCIQKSADLEGEAKKRNLRLEKGDDGIIRVKSLLLNRRREEEVFRKPVLLPKDNSIVEQLVMDLHLKLHHGGVQVLMSSLREKYWILQSRKVIQKVLKTCLRCQRFRARKQVVVPAPLPEDRVKDAKVFEIVGVDLAGPVFLKGGEKAWIVLFTCAVYRAVHLELVMSLSTDAFLLALFRFIAIRGRPSTIHSDNGTNFKGADNFFVQIDWGRVETETGLQRIKWKFNPPSAAWWGGWWERLIQEVKKLLLRMIGKARLNYVEMDTALCEVMSTVNARPLTYVTEDGDDLIPLTPAMFLQELKGDECPEWRILNADELRHQYKKLTTLREQLRYRFRGEYLGLLVQRSRTGKPHCLREGDIVLVGQDNKKRLEWAMARILELIQGKDGEVRVAKVKTEKGVLIRPIQRLYPLEICSREEEAIPITAEVKKIAKSEKKKKQQDRKDAEKEDDGDMPVMTKSGRRSKKPQRYGYVNLSSLTC